VAVVVEPTVLIARIGAKVKNKDFPWIDLGIAAEHFCLQAAADGLGTCMLGWFKEDKARNLLNIPCGKRLGLIITLGYPWDE
jgi:nitroreductase